MKQKELTKTFMMISNLKKPLVAMAYAEIFQRCKGEEPYMDMEFRYQKS